MISFGQAKNSLQKLKSYLKKMQYFDSINRLALKDLEQSNLRLRHNEIFLPLLNFLLIDYSTDLYIQILDRLPNIKYKDDRKFVQDVLNIARELFKFSPTLTVDQFLSGKYFQKKLEFVSNLAKAVYEKAEGMRKNKGKDNKDKEIYQMVTNVEQYQFNNELDDFEQEVPMTITAVPMKFDVEELKKQKGAKEPQKSKFSSKGFQNNSKFVVNGEQFDEDEVERALEERHPTPINRKPVDEPIQITDRTKPGNKAKPAYNEYESFPQEKHYHEEEDDEDSKYDRFRLDQNKNKVKPHHLHHGNKAKPHSHEHKHEAEPEEVPFVTRQEFNQLVGLIKVVSETVNEISSKFGALQAHVDTQVSNMNARIMMLESSVRLLKDNL